MDAAKVVYFDFSGRKEKVVALCTYFVLFLIDFVSYGGRYS